MSDLKSSKLKTSTKFAELKAKPYPSPIKTPKKIQAQKPSKVVFESESDSSSSQLSSLSPLEAIVVNSELLTEINKINDSEHGVGRAFGRGSWHQCPGKVEKYIWGKLDSKNRITPLPILFYGQVKEAKCGLYGNVNVGYHESVIDGAPMDVKRMKDGKLVWILEVDFIYSLIIGSRRV